MERQIVGAMLDALPIPAILVQGSGKILRLNRLAEDLFGTDLTEDSFHLHFRRPALIDALNRAAAENISSVAKHQTVNAAEPDLELSFSPLGLPSGDRMVLVVCRDTSREYRIERMRSDFVANASHELRTPLTTLSGFIDTMQGAARQDDKMRDEFLRLMKAQADRMSTLIDDLLSLSRIELDEHVEPKDTLDLGAVVRQAGNLLNKLASDAGCEVVYRVSNGVKIKGDASQLGQVAHNLIENAIKYSGRGKQVVVDVKVEDRQAVFAVADNGPGIAAHHIPRLTERFYRVNVQESRTRGGTGLGLAICKHIINRHRGRLQIESEPGQGSIFRVFLPLKFN